MWRDHRPALHLGHADTGWHRLPPQRAIDRVHVEEDLLTDQAGRRAPAAVMSAMNCCVALVASSSSLMRHHRPA